MKFTTRDFTSLSQGCGARRMGSSACTPSTWFRIYLNGAFGRRYFYRSA